MQEKLSLAAINQTLIKCESCHICGECSAPTAGSGEESPIVFVGRNPGIQEDKIGIPFMGHTRNLMDEMFLALGLAREQVYITNVVKCYTSNPKPDRPPTKGEIEFCTGQWLDKEIDTLDPKLVVTLGKDAFLHFVDGYETCSGHTGEFFKIRDGRTKVFCMYHPGMIMRAPNKWKPGWVDCIVLLQQYLESNDYFGVEHG